MADLGVLENYTGTPFLPSDSDILLDSPDQDDIGILFNAIFFWFAYRGFVFTSLPTLKSPKPRYQNPVCTIYNQEARSTPAMSLGEEGLDHLVQAIWKILSEVLNYRIQFGHLTTPCSSY